MRTHAHVTYYSVLEHAVMWLVAVCAGVALMQLAALAGWRPIHHD